MRCEVIVEFDKSISPDLQGELMLKMEKALREAGYDAEVFKKTMADDSKLRLRMTTEEREKL